MNFGTHYSAHRAPPLGPTTSKTTSLSPTKAYAPAVTVHWRVGLLLSSCIASVAVPRAVCCRCRDVWFGLVWFGLFGLVWFGFTIAFVSAKKNAQQQLTFEYHPKGIWCYLGLHVRCLPVHMPPNATLLV